MKVLKILALVFGAIAFLTGVGMFLGSTAVSRGSEALNTQMSQQGFVGPVVGVVKGIDPSNVYTVEFTDQQGAAQTGTGATATSEPKVGDTVKLFYYKDNPQTIVIADLGSVGAILRTGGLITGGVGLVLLLAGILGLVIGRQAPAPPVALDPAQSYPQPYPSSTYPPIPTPSYPPRPGSPYPPSQYQPPPQQQ